MPAKGGITMGARKQTGRIRYEAEKEQEIVNVNVPVSVAVQTTPGAGDDNINVGASLQAFFQNDNDNRIRASTRNLITQRERAKRRAAGNNKRPRETGLPRAVSLARPGGCEPQTSRVVVRYSIRLATSHF